MTPFFPTTRPESSTYPFNLVRDLHIDTDDDITEHVYPHALYEAIDNLPENGRNYITWHYRDKLPKYKCAERLGLSTSHFQDLEMLTLQTLRNPVVSSSYIGMSKSECDRSDDQIATTRAENDTLKELVCQLVNGSIKPYDVTITDRIISNDELSQKEKAQRPIETLRLSNGAYNACKRNGYHRIYDLLHAGRETVKNKRGIGNNYFNEIMHVLEQQGFTLNDHTPELPNLYLYKSGIAKSIHIQFITEEPTTEGDQ